MMSVESQSIGATLRNYHQAANKYTAANAKILQADKVILVDYDFKKFGSSEERKRSITH